VQRMLKAFHWARQKVWTTRRDSMMDSSSAETIEKASPKETLLGVQLVQPMEPWK
jgi:hypothetical protein